MSNCTIIRRLTLPAVLLLAVVVVAAASGQKQPTPHFHTRTTLAAAANTTFEKGVHSRLPPHISTLLGISHEEERAVMQNVVRTPNHVQGLDVSIANKQDVILFVVDESANDQTLYLTSPEGSLRRVVKVKAGVGTTAPITEEDRKVFQKERQFWVDRLTPSSTK